MRLLTSRNAILVCAAILSCLVALTSCSRSRRPSITDKVPLTRVKGVVLVDGVPATGVQIQYVPQTKIAEHRERYVNRFFVFSKDGGKFALSTYIEGDGVPDGTYVLEFKWFEQQLSGEIDRLGGVYSDPGSPYMTINVKKGPDVNLGEIQLKTNTNAVD